MPSKLNVRSQPSRSRLVQHSSLRHHAFFVSMLNLSMLHLAHLRYSVGSLDDCREARSFRSR
jgi:hypothetical protein